MIVAMHTRQLMLLLRVLHCRQLTRVAVLLLRVLHRWRVMVVFAMGGAADATLTGVGRVCDGGAGASTAGAAAAGLKRNFGQM
jgi:hypothetical protein